MGNKMNPCNYLKDEKQIEAIRSIRRLDADGYLYHMICDYDYYDLPDMFKAIIDAGCSTFVTKTPEDDVLFGRNYDYLHYRNNDRVHNSFTGINMVVEGNSPKAKYRTIGCGDAYWIDFRNGTYANGMADDGTTDLSGFVLCPYLCMDGMNEKGLALSILALGVKTAWEEIDFATYKEKMNPNFNHLELKESGEEPDPYWIKARNGSIAYNEKDRRAWIGSQELIETKQEGKPTYLHPIIMRMVLDSCADVDEAIAMFSGVNIKGAMPGADYHIMVADASGRSKLIEWVDGKMVTTDIDHATNHYVAKEDPFYKEPCGRDEILKAGLYRTRKGGMEEDFALNLLKMAIQHPENGRDNGKTQYTALYNLTKKTVKVYSFGDMSRCWEFSL